MKKIIAVLFALSLSASMVACSSSSENVKPDTPAESAPAAPAEGEETTEEEAPKKSLKKDEGTRMERPTDDE